MAEVLFVSCNTRSTSKDYSNNHAPIVSAWFASALGNEYTYTWWNAETGRWEIGH